MNYRDTATKLAAWREQIAEIRGRMREAQASVEPEPVRDYEFTTPDGPVRLSQLFGDKRDLFVIHNMGRSCPACTLWADGFNGSYPHIADRAAFVVSSPDSPDVQRAFAASRGWRFPMVSHQGHQLCRGYGLPVGKRRLAAWRIRVQARRCTDPSHSRHQLPCRAMISARSGTCWICCPKVRTDGGRSLPTSDRSTLLLAGLRCRRAAYFRRQVTEELRPLDRARDDETMIVAG